MGATNHPDTPKSFSLMGKLTLRCRYDHAVEGSDLTTSTPANCSTADDVRDALNYAFSAELGTVDGYSLTASAVKFSPDLIKLVGDPMLPLLAAVEPAPIDGCPGWSTYHLTLTSYDPSQWKAIEQAWEAMERDTSLIVEGLDYLGEEAREQDGVSYCHPVVEHQPPHIHNPATSLSRILATSTRKSLAPSLTLISPDDRTIADVVKPGEVYIILASNFPPKARVKVQLTDSSNLPVPSMPALEASITKSAATIPWKVPEGLPPGPLYWREGLLAFTNAFSVESE